MCSQYISYYITIEPMYGRRHWACKYRNTPGLGIQVTLWFSSASTLLLNYVFTIHSLLDFINAVFTVDVYTGEDRGHSFWNWTSFELDDSHTPSGRDYVLYQGSAHYASPGCSSWNSCAPVCFTVLFLSWLSVITFKCLIFRFMYEPFNPLNICYNHAFILMAWL